MSDLNYLERMQFEELFGMKSGYVLDFSDKTFQQFILESVQKNIFDEKYRQGSGSKANRLRAFWRIEANALVGKLMKDVCDYYEFKKGSDGNDKQLSACLRAVQRLLGDAQKTSPPRHYESPRSEAAITETYDTGHSKPVAELAILLRKFDDMAVSSDPQRRGYLLQDVLAEAFSLSKIPIFRPFTRNSGAEQIDAAFKFEGWHYIVECRWRERLADIRQLDGLFGQVQRSGKQTMGLFLSINGWSQNVPSALKMNTSKCILLMDGYDLRCVLDGQVSLSRLLSTKLAHLNIESEPFLSAAEMIGK
jgi:hypothetical protein